MDKTFKEITDSAKQFILQNWDEMNSILEGWAKFNIGCVSIPFPRGHIYLMHNTGAQVIRRFGGVVWTTLKETPLTPEPYNVDLNDVKYWCLCEDYNVYGPYHFFVGFYGTLEDGTRRWYNQEGYPLPDDEGVERFILI